MVIHMLWKLRKSFIVFILMAALLLSPVGIYSYGSQAGDVYSYEEIDNAYGNTKDLLTEIAGEDGWSSECVWIVMALARAGELDYSWGEAYRDEILYMLQDAGSEVLNSRQSSDNSRAILALTAVAYDATDIGGYDLTAPLADIDYVKAQGINGPIWALIALDSAVYELPEPEDEDSQNIRDVLIESILSAEKSGGGWSYSGSGSDVDMTCMAIQALSPYYGDDEVANAVDRAIDWLSDVQGNDASFSSGGVKTSESASQVIVALCSLGIDPESDGRFVKNGRTVLDALMDFYVKGGGFKHIHDNYKQNTLASMQAFYALVAWYRYRFSWNSLYDMRDAGQGMSLGIEYSSDEDMQQEETEENRETEPESPKEDKSHASSNTSGGTTVGNVSSTERTPESQKESSTEAQTEESKETEDAPVQPESILSDAAGFITAIIRDEENRERETEAFPVETQEESLEEEPDTGIDEVRKSPWADIVISLALGIAAAALMGMELKKKCVR